MGSRNGATSKVFGATSKVIDAMSAVNGGMSERGDETAEISVAMAELASANGRRRASIATNGGATKGHVLSIERQTRAIAKSLLQLRGSTR
jgi:hypothetical protein